VTERRRARLKFGGNAMDSTRRIFTLLVFLSLPACFAQNAASPDAQPTETTAPIRNSHSTKEDLAVPLCPAALNDSLASDGIATSDDKSVKLPVARYQPEAEFTDKARRLKAKDIPDGGFEVEISLVVDVNGAPQNVCLKRSAGFGLDANAAGAVRKYRFDPATKDGRPVPFRIEVGIEFHLY
jgi:TonB family protein